MTVPVQPASNASIPPRFRRPDRWDRLALRDDLLRRVAATADPGAPPGVLGGRLDTRGDPTLMLAAELWSRVADGVAAYTEIAQGETGVGSARDWTDLRRVVELLGYRPAQRAAASGWIRAEVTAGSSPLLSAGTQVQAPGTAAYPAQTYEVATDTQLRADWADLTITGVPVPGVPAGNELRFLRDPGFRSSDRVVFVAESGVPVAPIDWVPWLIWYFGWYGGTYVPPTGETVRGLARVTKRTDDLGAVLIAFDRPLADLLPASTGTSYAAYRVRETLTLAARLDKLSYIDSNGAAKVVDAPTVSGEPTVPYDDSWILVNDGSAVSVGQRVVLYAGTSASAFVGTVASVTPYDWHVAPGTVKRVAQIQFTADIPSPLRTRGLSALLVDSRQPAQHYELPPLGPTDTLARLHPGPAVLPPALAIRTVPPGDPAANGNPGGGWERARCTAAAENPVDPGGMLLSLTDRRTRTADRSAATGNLAPIRHGTTSTATLTPVAGTAVVDGPVAQDVAADGTVANSLVVRVDGVRFDEVPSLFGRGPAEPVYTTKLVADGRLVLTFGNGITGALPRGAILAEWRIGGGTVGELPGTAITTLLGAVNGVRKIGGIGTLSGAADQEDTLRIRKGAGARIRALDRGVALGDLADLALTVPGVSHSAAWRGPGPAGCPCGRSGLHVATLRRTATGVRPPYPGELTALSGFLDARRDTTVAVCVCAAVPSALTIAAKVAADTRRDAAAVRAAARAAVLDPTGPLAAWPRDLGVPLDGSDVLAVAHPVPGVLGIVQLTITGSLTAPSAGDLSLGRVSAARYELLYVDAVEFAELRS